MSRSFGFPLPWSMDLTMLMFGWFGFLAASQATRRGAHLGVDILTRLFPKKVQQQIALVNKVIMSIFLAVMIYCGFALSVNNSQRMINSLNISYSVTTMSLSVGCLLMLISLIIQIVQQIRVVRGTITEEQANEEWKYSQ
jgi:TRAP-type C4-dicarboxylate transport system permease small subunit